MNTRYGFVRAARQFGLAWACGLLMAALMVLIAAVQDLPIRDPDDVMPGYIQFPLIVLAAIALDIVPRVAHRARVRRSWRPRALRGLLGEVVGERWPASHWWFALNGLLAWYLCYATFRNVKSMAPFVNPREWDATLAQIDRFLFAGHDPAAVMHAWFGTGFAAHLLSFVYVAWIALVPVSIAIALVWTRQTTAGAWFVTALAVDWVLGALLYLLVPTVGPIYSDPGMFDELPRTYVTRLQEGMWDDRVAVLADPRGADALQTIAAFASLHVGIMVTICLIARLVAVPRWVEISAWVFLALTVLSTVYLGWHFAADVVGGVALGSFAVWLAGVATGNRVGWRVRLVRPEQAAGPLDPVGASDARPSTLD
ncbi:phosphatase PAP2 family protein [Nocardioides sp. YIM 152588]|uniref:phosphatase PAP2 family protein n=1 Tax=Nocardioides sp. YIM 152588 TaxID=3158259 RepID=UPI0032E3948A